MNPTRIITAMLVAASPAFAQPHFKFFEPVVPARTVQVMAHRGLAMLAPENSLPAVLECAKDFIEWAEVDVRRTKDGHHIVIHDDTVDGTTNGHGRVAELTLAELKQLDAGKWFAPRFAGQRLQSLPEVLAAAKGKVNLYLDCKQVDPELLVKQIREAKMEPQVVVYGDRTLLDKVRAAADNSIAIMAKYHPGKTAVEQFINQIEPAAIELDAADVTPELCRQFHEYGVKVEAKVLGKQWDNLSVWSFVIEAGVDWLQTDDPAGVRFTEVRKRIGRFPVQFACHRGANRYAPENSVAAIRTAASLGANYIEIDIRTTSDGQFMLLHDGNLNRTTNGKGPFKQQTAAAIGKLDCGTWFGREFVGTRVPQFDEALTAYGDQASAYLDAKDIAPAALAAAIQRHNLLQRHVVYQSPEYGERLKAIEPAVRMLLPLGDAKEIESLAKYKPYGFDTDWPILSKDLIDRCHAVGAKVFSDALGNHETIKDYRQAIGWGIDVIQTDHPLRVLRAIELETGK
jgi:glycerophosphoryl diester phosphodiesterase